MNRLYLLLAGALMLCGCASDVDEALGLPPVPPALGVPIARAGRPLSADALVAGLAADGARQRRLAQYEHAAPSDWPQFSADIAQSLSVLDGFDGQCGNQWLAAREGPPAARYRALATLLADDRLWIDSRSTACDRFFAVELDALGGAGLPTADCGGRAPGVAAVEVLRSLLVLGRTTGFGEGADRAVGVRPAAEFPFLANP